MIETALPSGIGQAPIFRSFGPQKMAGGEGDEPDRPPTPTFAARLAMWRSTVLGDRYRRAAMSLVESPSASNVNTSASLGVTPAADKASGRSGAGRWRRVPGRRPAGGGIGRRRPPPVAARVEEREGFGQPTRRVSPPVANGRLGHQSAGMMAIPVAGGKSASASAKASSASAIWPRRPSSTARAWPPIPGSASTRSGRKPLPRPPRLAHRRGRGHGAGPTDPAGGRDRGVSATAPCPRRARPGPADGPPGPATAAPGP